MIMSAAVPPWPFRRCRNGTSWFLLLLTPALACRGEAIAKDRDAVPLVVGYVAPASGPGESALHGAQLGADEAGRAGVLLGRALVLHTARATGVHETIRAATALVDTGALAIVGGFDEASCAALGRLARERGVLYLNVGCRHDALREEPAAATTFHVEASDAMYLGALGAARESGGAAPVLWHAGLARYGAAQLNERFVRRFGYAPDAAAWASWMAMKVLWQASLDAAPSDAAALATRLLADSAEFDGHKGEALRFDRTTRQLQQPLFPPLAAEGAPVRHDPSVTLGVATATERAALARAVLAGAPLLVVTNEGSADVTILHAARGEPLATLRFAERPRGIHVSRDGRRAWVALSDEAPTREGDGDGIAVIDLHEGRLVTRHAAGSDPEQFAVSGDGRILVAANEDAGTATLTDLRSGEVLATLVVGIEPEGVAMSPDARWVYVTAETSNTVSVIDTRRREVVASFLVDERPRAAVFAPDGTRAYVTNEISGTMSVIDVARHAVVATVELAGGRARPVGVVVSPDGVTVYVANGRANSVSVIDAATLRETGVIDVGRRPWGLALTHDGARLYTANGGSNDLSVIDTHERRVVATIPVGERPWGVAVTR